MDKFSLPDPHVTFGNENWQNLIIYKMIVVVMLFAERRHVSDSLIARNHIFTYNLYMQYILTFAFYKSFLHLSVNLFYAVPRVCMSPSFSAHSFIDHIDRDYVHVGN